MEWVQLGLFAIFSTFSEITTYFSINSSDNFSRYVHNKKYIRAVNSQKQ